MSQRILLLGLVLLLGYIHGMLTKDIGLLCSCHAVISIVLENALAQNPRESNDNVMFSTCNGSTSCVTTYVIDQGGGRGGVAGPPGKNTTSIYHCDSA